MSTIAQPQMRVSDLANDLGEINSSFDGLWSGVEPQPASRPVFAAEGKAFFLAFVNGQNYSGWFNLDGNAVPETAAPKGQFSSRPAQRQDVDALAVSPDGKLRVNGQGEISAVNGQLSMSQLDGPPPIGAALFSRDGLRVVTAHRNDAILWDRTPLRPARRTKVNTAGKAAVLSAGSPDEVFVVTKAGIEHWNLARQRATAASPLIPVPKPRSLWSR